MPKGVCVLTPRLREIRARNARYAFESTRERHIERIKTLHAQGRKLDGTPILGPDSQKLRAKQLRQNERRKTKEWKASHPRHRTVIQALAHRLRSAIRSCLKKNDWGTHRLPFRPVELREHINRKLDERNHRCPMCGTPIERFHIDHRVPISSAKTAEELIGLFALSNLDVLCPTCNMSKHAKLVSY